MHEDLIFAPMGAMALLTFAVLLLAPIARLRAAFAGQVRPDDFKARRVGAAAGQGLAAKPQRHEPAGTADPVLPGLLMFSVALRVDSLVVHIAWAFLVLRALHSAIHLTYNDVKHRLVAFALGNVALGTQVG